MPNPRKSLLITAIAVAMGGGVWVAMRPAEPFMPHGHCYLWDPGLLWTHVVSDVLIGLAYVSISGTLCYLVVKGRRNLPFHWMVIAFGGFIVACGATHFVEAWNVWHADYWFAGFVKVVTAIASVATAICLPPLVPAVIRLLDAARLQRQQKEALEAEVEQRLAAEAGLRKMKDTLEQRVRERTSDLSQANSALSLYETIFTGSAWGVAIIDSVRGLVQLANPAFARMHGYEAEEMTGMPIANTFAPESAAKLPQVVDIVNARDHLMYESVHMRKDKTLFACLTDVTLVRDPQGLPLYRFAYFQEISSQKRAEEDIRNVVTHARCILWRAIVEGKEGWEESEPGGVSKFNWQLTIQDEVAAQHFQPLNVPTGVTYEQAWLGSRHPEDIGRMEATAAKAFVNGSSSYSQQFRCLDKFGETLWIREEVAIVRIGPGKWQCTGVCMDITDEHRLNEQLRQQAELLELSHDAIIVRNEEGGIIYWNTGAEDLYGWERQEVIGKNIHELLTTRTHRDEFVNALRERGYWAGRLRQRAKDGREITVDSRHLLVHRADGVKVVLETNHDMGARAQTEVVDGEGNADFGFRVAD
jgi:PAS domain S-box-containing protein